MAEAQQLDKVVSVASATAPGHITGLFQIFSNGSTGAGLNPELGAHTKVYVLASNTSDEIFLNGEPSDARVSKTVLDAFAEYREGKSLRVEHQIDYPIGFGMGMSGAGAYSLSLALNQALGAGLDPHQCMLIAKESEIRCGTGLGDVVAQQFPGVMMGLPPYPSTEVAYIEGPESYVACAFFEALSTESIIRSPHWVERINRVGEYCMAELSKNCTRSTFMELSRHFALETELPSEQVKAVMQAVPQCSMAMLGQTVFLLCNSVAEGIGLLEPFSEHIIVSKIAERGAYVHEHTSK